MTRCGEWRMENGEHDLANVENGAVGPPGCHPTCRVKPLKCDSLAGRRQWCIWLTITDGGGGGGVVHPVP